MSRVCVVVPTYNEAENLSKLIPLLLQLFESNRLDAWILIVDDASPDGTGDVADDFAAHHSNVVVIHRRSKLGIGGAYKEGFSKALADQETQVIVEMDADFSHDPIYLPQIVQAAKRCHGVGLGSRYIEGGRIVGWPKSRQIVSLGANFLVRTIVGLPVKDATSGYRAYERTALEKAGYLDAGTKAYAFQVEMLHRCARQGFPIEEVPITFHERQVGKSKLTRSDIVDFLRTAFRLGFRP
jgi:dolichol-phosphate mannosyltransferase